LTSKASMTASHVLHHVVGEGAGDVPAGQAGQPGGQLSKQVVEAVGFAAAERGHHLGRLSTS
jgi:hypothetical protein